MENNRTKRIIFVFIEVVASISSVLLYLLFLFLSGFTPKDGLDMFIIFLMPVLILINLMVFAKVFSSLGRTEKLSPAERMFYLLLWILTSPLGILGLVMPLFM